MYYYTFEQGIEGFVGAGDEIFKQPWIYVSNTIAPFEKALERDQFSEEGGTFDAFKRTLEEINELVNSQGIFYTKASGEPNYKGGAMKRHIEESAEKTQEINNIKNKMNISLLKNSIIKYNDNLEQAMIEQLVRIIKNICAQYNKYEIEVNGRKDKIEYTSLLNRKFSSLKALKTSQIMKELSKSPRDEYISKINIPDRPEETKRETK